MNTTKGEVQDQMILAGTLPESVPLPVPISVIISVFRTPDRTDPCEKFAPKLVRRAAVSS